MGILVVSTAVGPIGQGRGGGTEIAICSLVRGLVDGGPSHDPGAGRNSSHGMPLSCRCVQSRHVRVKRYHFSEGLSGYPGKGICPATAAVLLHPCVDDDSMDNSSTTPQCTQQRCSVVTASWGGRPSTTPLWADEARATATAAVGGWSSRPRWCVKGAVLSVVVLPCWRLPWICAPSLHYVS